MTGVLQISTKSCYNHRHCPPKKLNEINELDNENVESRPLRQYDKASAARGPFLLQNPMSMRAAGRWEFLCGFSLPCFGPPLAPLSLRPRFQGSIVAFETPDTQSKTGRLGTPFLLNPALLDLSI